MMVLLATFRALPADAQICAGRASFNLASTHVGLDAGVSASGYGIGVAVGYGTDTLFGIASGATHSVDGTGGVNMIAGTIGTDQPLTPDNRLHVCPMITVGYVSDAIADGDGSRVGVSAAGDAGLLVVNTPRLRVTPTIGIDLRSNGVGRTAGVFVHPTRRYHTFSAGIGFVIWNRLSLVPRVVVPFGPIDRSGLQMTVGYNMLRR